MAIDLRDASPTIVLAELDRLFASRADFGEEFERIIFGDWAALHVYVPQPEIQSAITPPFMEAFLVLQKQLYQFAALVKTGVADIGQLGDADRAELLLSVEVSGGSSDYLAKLQKPLTAILNRMAGKMTGRQAAIVIVALAALIASGWSFKAWLDQTKEIKLEELKSKDHVTALEALQFSNKEQSEAFRKIIEILEKQGEAGRRALEVINQSNDALLKAASSNPKTRIKDVELTRTEADLLRTPTRKRAQQKIVQQEVKVVDINTTDPLDLQIVLLEPARYTKAAQDCEKFFSLFKEAMQSIGTIPTTAAFDLSMVFLAIRNFATCFSLGFLDQPNFSRRSAIGIGDHSLSIEQNAFEILERSRILCTRAIGAPIEPSEAAAAIEQFPHIEAWMERLSKEVSCLTLSGSCLREVGPDQRAVTAAHPLNWPKKRRHR